MRHGRAGRVVGRAHEDDAGALGDRRGHGIEVVPVVCGQWHLHRDCAGDGDDDRVGLEGAPGVDDLVARVAGRLDDLGEDADGPGARGDLLPRHVEVLGESIGECRNAHVGVPVDLRDRLLDDREHRRERRVGVLVGRDLVDGQPCPGAGGLPAT